METSSAPIIITEAKNISSISSALIENLYKILEDKVVPLYYDKNDKWLDIAFASMKDVLPEFGSHRMAAQYYDELY